MNFSKLRRATTLPAIAGALAAVVTTANAAELDLRIEGLSATGDIYVYVFTSPDGFPKEESAALHRSFPRPPAAQNELTARVEVPDAAQYAVVVFQDEDGNGKMNRLLGMIPQEPYGLSRNPDVFGKPKFPDAAVSGDSAHQAPLVIKMHR